MANEQNIIFTDTDESGNKVIQFPLAHAGWIEGLSRTPETAYAAGDLVICPYHVEFMLKCTTAGTTSADKTIDTTSATKDGTIKDGTVTWTVIAKAIIDASISGKTITLTFADGTTKTLTTQDTTGITLADVTPNYSAGVSTSNGYSAPKAGWFIGHANHSNDTNCQIYINGALASREWADFASIQVMVQAGDKITFTNLEDNQVKFYPCRGA